MVLCSRVNGHPIAASQTPPVDHCCQHRTSMATGDPCAIRDLPPAADHPNGTVCHHTQAGHQAWWGHRSLDGVRTQGLPYHKFLNSPVQEQGVWSRFSNNRWSVSRDRLWSRAFLSHSVKNSSSYFSPLKWMWLAPFWSVFLCHGGHGHR